MAASSTASSREQPYATQSAVFQPLQQYSGPYSFEDSAEGHLIPLPSLHHWEESTFPGVVPLSDTVNSESVVDMKPGDSDVVIGYQVDEFTHAWSAEHFIDQSHIYPWLMSEVPSLTHFPLEPGCGDYSFLEVVADFE